VSAAEVVAGGSAMRRSAQSPRLNFFGIGITDTYDEHHHDIWMAIQIRGRSINIQNWRRAETEE